MSTLRSVVHALGLQTLGGLVVWVLVATVAANVDSASLDLVTVLLLLGQLVVVPLGLLLVPGPRGTAAGALLDGGRFLFPVGGIAAIASLAFLRGELSAAVASLYLVPALLVGASALLDARALRSTSDAPGVVARLMLVGGALLFVLHRQDVAFAGLPELSVQLGAVHLHFVGFGLLLMAGTLAGRASRLGTLACWMVAAGALPASIGSLVHPALVVIGAVLVLGGLLALVAGTFPVLADAGVRPAARRLLFVSIACSAFVGLMAAMSMLGAPAAEIGSMVRLHGAFAAAGVVLIGLLGWRLAEAR
jgi:YndJ-like protein